MKKAFFNSDFHC